MFECKRILRSARTVTYLCREYRSSSKFLLDSTDKNNSGTRDSDLPRRGDSIPMNSFSDSTLSSKKSSEAVDSLTVPNDFFDDNVESEKEFMDILSSLRDGNLENLVTVKDTFSWSSIESSKKFDLHIKDFAATDDDNSNDIDMFAGDEEAIYDPNTPEGLVSEVIGNRPLADHIDEIDGLNESFTYMPEAMLNYNLPWRKSDEYPDDKLDKFVPETSTEKYRYDQQGLRHCPGKMQRQGSNNVLRCHIIDLDQLHSLDVLNLRRFLSDDSEILGRQASGLCAKCQRKVAKSIKRARNFGIVPHLGEYIIRDSRPLSTRYYDVVKGQKVVESKSILS